MSEAKKIWLRDNITKITQSEFRAKAGLPEQVNTLKTILETHTWAGTFQYSQKHSQQNIQCFQLRSHENASK